MSHMDQWGGYFLTGNKEGNSFRIDHQWVIGVSSKYPSFRYLASSPHPLKKSLVLSEESKRKLLNT